MFAGWVVIEGAGFTVMVVDEEMISPLPRVMVWGVAKTVGSKVMLPPLGTDAASASRRLQFGEFAPVQFDAMPEVVSVVTVTTKPGFGFTV